jgi:para-nitrobenzyl esterase
MATLFERALSLRPRRGSARTLLRTGLAFGMILCSAALLAPTQSYAAAGPTVATAQGKVQGFVVNGIYEFLGIPYAAPPVGKLRWRPPVKHAAWSNTLQATSYAPICAQVTTLGVYAGPANSNEDCLYLNVFTPLPKKSQKLPVIFWIHGGGNYDGETPGYDGSKMAAQGTVVVSIEYRLNLFGFLAVPSLDSEDHPFGNYGILDQQFALQWVHDNIAKFGGDPSNVTVGGQSAGATDTSINLVSPLAKGLFQHAICESECAVNEAPLATSVADGTAFANAAGCGTQTGAAQAACLRALPAATVEALAGTTSAASSFVGGPMVDGTILPIQPIVAWHTGAFNKPMTVMNGSVADEENFFLNIIEYFETPPKALTAAQYQAAITTAYSAPNALTPGQPYPAGTAQAILTHYPVSAYPSAQLAWDAALTDPIHCRDAHIDGILGPQVPLYAYQFDDRTAPNYFPRLPGFVGWAYHTADQQYLFPGWSGGPLGTPHSLNKLQGILSDELVAAWTNFAKTGNPNGVGNTPWPRYTAKRHAVLSENISALSTYTQADYNKRHQCAFWETIFPYTYGSAW